MHDPGKNPETLLSVPNDLEAAMIVSALAGHEVDATTAGEYTSGFRAEAPGEVKILVRRCDLERARRVLEELVPTQAKPRATAAPAAASGGLSSWRIIVGIVVVATVVGLLQSCQ